MLTAKTSSKGQIEVRPLSVDPIAELRGSLKGRPSLANKLIKEHRNEVKKDAKQT